MIMCISVSHAISTSSQLHDYSIQVHQGCSKQNLSGQMHVVSLASHTLLSRLASQLAIAQGKFRNSARGVLRMNNIILITK